MAAEPAQMEYQTAPGALAGGLLFLRNQSTLSCIQMYTR